MRWVVREGQYTTGHRLIQGKSVVGTVSPSMSYQGFDWYLSFDRIHGKAPTLEEAKTALELAFVEWLDKTNLTMEK